MDQISIKKAVAFFDMPSCCMECKLAHFDDDSGYYVCPLTGERSNCDNASRELGELCPLKVMEIKIDI